ncbi:Inositol polyphosphate kinase [Trinorchestia longiramus]|nr:Inositol polyphosphate kinase [Trinorchestia longiramus]
MANGASLPGFPPLSYSLFALIFPNVNRKDTDLKELFNNIKRLKEPHICKNKPNDEIDSQKTDTESHHEFRRNSLHSFLRRHSKKRQRKSTPCLDDLSSDISGQASVSHPAINIIDSDCDSTPSSRSHRANSSAGHLLDNDHSTVITKTNRSEENIPKTMTLTEAIAKSCRSTELSRKKDNTSEGKRPSRWALHLEVPLSSRSNSFSSADDDESLSDKEDGSMSMLQKLAMTALNLTAPASPMLLGERRNSWVQLSGHIGSLAPAGPGTVWKKRTPGSTETEVYRAIMEDAAKAIVPTFFREIHYNDEYFIEMTDLLYTFDKPSIMDVKMGTRTFLEGEIANSKPREDLYQKMVKVSPDEPTSEEHELGAVTKRRYLEFRDNLSSSRLLGFRIEAMKMYDSPTFTDFKTVRCKEQVADALASFMCSRDSVKRHVLAKLKELRKVFEASELFKRHEIIGSSILIVYDDTKAGAWIIDFAKTRPLPEGQFVTHRDAWVLGNHEEGFLYGLDCLIEVVEEVKTNRHKKFHFLRSC